MMAKSGRDVARCGNVSHQKKNRDTGETGEAGDQGENASSAANPITARSHRRAEQQGQRGIARHRVVFLSSGKREEHQDKSDPAYRQQTGAAGAVNRFEGKPDDGGEVYAPGE